jgi:putative transposase
MTRLARIVVPGWIHHLTQRGNHRQQVFFSDSDRLVYMTLLEKYTSLQQVALIGYCLMTNHIHLALIPSSKDSLGASAGRLHHDYARYKNLQSGQTGHLWQDRFFSCPVENDRTWQALGYIELNPVRVKLVANAWDWKWSSARAHATGFDPSGLLDMGMWRRQFDGPGWRKYLEEMARDQRLRDEIRKATATGRLLGSSATAERLERILGRPILPQRRGRKRRPQEIG